ncbi:unnamed protein product [Phaeothamnion confervicola]
MAAAMAGQGAWVFYYLQGEDGESESNPNVFQVPNASRDVRLGQFMESFPLRRHGGQYHFRFRAPDPVSGYCWLELRDPSATLPRYDDMVCAKVLRLDRLPQPKPSRLRRKPVKAVLLSRAQAPAMSPPAGINGGGATGFSTTPPRPPAPDSSSGPPSEPVRSQSGGALGAQRARSASPIPVPTSAAAAGRTTPRGAAAGGGASGGQPLPGRNTTPPSSQQDGSAAGSVHDFFQDGSRGGGGGAAASSASASPVQPPAAASRGSPRGGIGIAPPPPARQRSSGGPNDLLNFDVPAAGGGAQPPPPPPPGAAEWASPVQTAPSSNGAPNSGGGVGVGSAADLMSMGAAAAWGGPTGGARSHTAPNSPDRPGAGAYGGRGPPGAGGPSSGTGMLGGGIGIGGGSVGGQSAYVIAAKEERKKKLEEDTAKALKFKKDIDAAAVREQEELDTAKTKWDARLTSWGEDHGKKRNVRTLLSTMHLVLWEGCRWQAASMADLIPPNKVKVAFRKAMLVVHPDKCVEFGSEARFIAKRVFEALNEAYATFAAQELG